MRRAARRVVPSSGPRHHDDSRHPIASITCRRTPLPVPQPPCRIAAKHPSRAARLAKIALSKTAAPSLRPLQSVSHGRLRRPTHRSQRPPGRQIAIDGNPHAAHRGFLPWRLSDAGPQCPLLDCEWAGIRNPSQSYALMNRRSIGGSAPIPAVQAAPRMRPGSTRNGHSALRPAMAQYVPKETSSGRQLPAVERWLSGYRFKSPDRLSSLLRRAAAPGRCLASRDCRFPARSRTRRA